MTPSPTRVRRRYSFAAWVLLLLLLVGAAMRAGADDESDAGAYGNTPDELLPYRQVGEPYKRFLLEPPTFRGPAGHAAEPAGLARARIGVLLPRSGPDAALGRSMERGVQLAIEEANAAGGCGPGLPFEAVFRDESTAWGAASNEAVDLVTNHGVRGFVGALGDASSHVLSRLLLKLETPMVNTAGSDPTLTEHMVPWLVRVRPDERQSGYLLARRIFHDDKHRRVAVLRSNDRYGRVGVKEFVDAARRLHRPIAVEVRFDETTRDWRAQVQRLRAVRADALLLWGRAAASGRALAAVRAAGIAVPVYGPDRLADDAFLAAAGSAAEGLVFTYPFSPRRAGAAWSGFVTRYRTHFGSAPSAVAGYAFDGTRLLLAAMRRAGLNRAHIREALFARDAFDGVTGPIRFDATHNNISEIVLGHVSNGSLHID